MTLRILRPDIEKIKTIFHPGIVSSYTVEACVFQQQKEKDFLLIFRSCPMKVEIKHSINSGLTLLEMVVVMAILAIGATVAVWGMNSLVPDLHLKAAVRHLKSDMHLARLTAIKQNTYIVSEFNTDDDSYIIYIDDGGGDSIKANNYTLDEGEKIVKSVRMHPHVNMYRAKFGFVVGKFAFNSRGTLNGPAGGVYMHNKMKSFRGVAVSRIGKITIKASADGSDWHRTN